MRCSAMSEKAWWLSDHPDAAAHRAFLEEHMTKEAPRRASLPRRKSSPEYISKREFERFQEYLGKQIAEELAKRDARIKELEDRPAGLQYAGVYKPDASYPKHTGVSHQGSVWVARKDFPTKQPGEPNSGWILACKRGRDGKNG
jgi:hypothetical protein